MATESDKDRFLRQKQQQKDYDLSKELQKEMRVEEEMLQDYFKEYKKPVKQDPTIVRKTNSTASSEDKKKLYKEALKPFQLYSLFYEFWQMKCPTEEERCALELCKDEIKVNVVKATLLSLAVTSLTSYKLRMHFSPAMHGFGVVTALLSGCTLGIINSTEYSLKQFEKLGSGYQLGRAVINEIEKYRMDKEV